MHNGSQPSSIRLRMQGLPAPSLALAAGAIAALRSHTGTFATKDVIATLADLRIPALANPSATLSRLRAQKMLVRPEGNTWAITPLGSAEIDKVMDASARSAILAEFATTPESELGAHHHLTIPPFLAPRDASVGLQHLLDASAFDRNVMLITRFPKDAEDHFTGLIPALRRAVDGHGLTLQLASDAMVEDTLWANVVTYMWGCKYAIVLMDSADGILNSNVLIEVGGMLMTGRRCAILRDLSVPTMPSDLVGHIYKPTDLSDHDSTVQLIHQWLAADLGLGRCADCAA